MIKDIQVSINSSCQNDQEYGLRNPYNRYYNLSANINGIGWYREWYVPPTVYLISSSNHSLLQVVKVNSLF